MVAFQAGSLGDRSGDGNRGELVFLLGGLGPLGMRPLYPLAHAAGVARCGRTPASMIGCACRQAVALFTSIARQLADSDQELRGCVPGGLTRRMQRGRPSWGARVPPWRSRPARDLYRLAHAALQRGRGQVAFDAWPASMSSPCLLPGRLPSDLGLCRARPLHLDRKAACGFGPGTTWLRSRRVHSAIASGTATVCSSCSSLELTARS